MTFGYIANRQVFVRGVSELTARPVFDNALRSALNNLAFSPDGRQLAFWTATDSTIQRVAVTGGIPVKVCATPNPQGLSWSGDDLVFATTAGIARVRADDFGTGRIEPHGKQHAVLEGIRRGTGIVGAAAAHYSFSNTATLVYLPGPRVATLALRLHLALFDEAGTAEQLKAPPSSVLRAAAFPERAFCRLRCGRRA